MSELNGGGLTKPALDELREKMRGVLGETISAEARRLSGTNNDEPELSLYSGPFWQTPEGEELKAYFQGLSNAVFQELHRLRKRITEVEAKPGLTYQGVWDAEKVYHVGDFVTDHGSLWHCWDANVGVRPGSSDTWQLAVQRGRDGKSKGDR